MIGRGGMGAVWRARDELLNRDVAVKEIIWPAEMDEAERETVRRRAVREAQMLARLRHPNVVGVYDFFEEDGCPAIVMELVPFRSLRDIVRDAGPLPPTRVARIGQSSYPGYHLIRLDTVPYPQAEKAADWQFTYDRDGVAVEVLNRNVPANAQHAYALYWSTPVSGWNTYYHYLQVFAATFQPAP